MNIEEEQFSIADIMNGDPHIEIIDAEEYAEVPVPSIEYTINDNYTLCADGRMVVDGRSAEYDGIKKDINEIAMQRDTEDFINGVSCYEQTGSKTEDAEEAYENIFSAIDFKEQIDIEAAVASICTSNETKIDNICNLCDKSFNSKPLLNQHLKNHPKINNIYDHINTVHKEHRQTYPCTYCPYETCYSIDIKKHIKEQHTRKTIYKCPHCAYLTSFRTSLRNHVKVEHTRKIIYQCPDCEFSSARKNALNEHMKDKHTSVCPVCDFSSSDRILLSNHVNSLHDNYFYFTCPDCNYKTYYRTSLREHMIAEHKDNVTT